MKYDFDKIIDRRNTGSYKWNVADGELPMWVADMDFQAAPEIHEVLKKRMEHGVFGYSTTPDEWQDAYVNWWKKRHHFEIDPEWLIFVTGIVPAISTAVRKLTTPAEKVLIQTPVYNIFFNSIINNGRYVIENPLVYKDGVYAIDFDDLDAKMADPQTTLMILCNPHNPVGKLWDRETLAKIGELAWKHNVVVVSDEIHCDITDPGKEYVPFASVSEHCRMNSVTCISPTKCFNLAGLQTAAVSVPNPVLRHKMWRALNTDEVAEGNVFSVPAAIAAFNYGAAWLDELREYIYQNKQTVAEYIKNYISDIKLVPSEATYLLWLDCSALKSDSETIAKSIRANTGLFVTAGEHYGKNGDQFLRMNIACPRAYVLDGLDRLKRGVEMLKG